jgi:hypothetical protein
MSPLANEARELSDGIKDRLDEALASLPDASAIQQARFLVELEKCSDRVTKAAGRLAGRSARATATAGNGTGNGRPRR